MPALLQSDSLIAITGITGYISSHVGLAALQAGHHVRGTVRSLMRAESLKAAYVKQGISASDLDRRLEIVVVDDLVSLDQWYNAIKGVDGVVHLALGLDGVEVAVQVTLSLLRAAKQVPSIQRVVVTSASQAAISAPMYRDKVLTDEDWNDDVVRIIENHEPTDNDPILSKAAPFMLYAAGKTKAEKAAWEFMRNEKPHFDLVSTLPNTNTGPVLHGEPPSTAGWVSRVLKNDPTIMHWYPAQWYIDVRDCGRLHVLCLTTPSVSGKRIWAAAAPFGWNQILSILRKNFPDLQVPADIEDGEPDRQKIENRIATELLGGWIGLEQSLVDLAKSLGY